MISTWVPAFAPSHRCAAGRRYARGPHVAPSSTCASTATVSSTTQPRPTAVSVRRESGPMTLSSPMLVSPMSMTFGSSSTSCAMVTSGPIHTSSGSTMVTPAAICARLMRRCANFVASANWMREFTPRHSAGSSQTSASTGRPALRQISSTSVR